MSGTGPTKEGEKWREQANELKEEHDPLLAEHQKPSAKKAAVVKKEDEEADVKREDEATVVKNEEEATSSSNAGETSGSYKLPGRLYNHFWTQWSVGIGEFADKPMRTPPEEDQYNGFFKAHHTTAYLEQYASDHTYNGKSLESRMKFCTTVVNVQKNGGGWVVDTVHNRNSQRFVLETSKLVIASGMTSVPKAPHLNGKDIFPGPIIHTLDFGSSQVLTTPDIEHITVLGGGKSGADMVYACAKAGKRVAWIVKPSGTGPATFATPKGKGPFQNSFELGKILYSITTDDE
ncbi:MAG: hypothetical protein Q9159_001343 [Coniocarpon cinnabarinum]